MFRDLQEPLEDGVREELAGIVDFPLCDPPYNVKSQSVSGNTNHDVSEPNEMEDFCNLAGKLRKPVGHGHVFCPALQFSSWWKII